MSLVITDDKHYKNIADTIREYAELNNDGNDIFAPQEMPFGISLVRNKGYDIGYHDGYHDGYGYGEVDGFTEGYNYGYDEGETNGKDLGNQEAYDTFWDNFQQNGKRVSYLYAFHLWNDTIFKPKYPIIPTGNADSIFRAISDIEDLAEYFEENDITVDLSSVTSCNDGFGNFGGKRIGEINLSNCGYYNFMFSGCKNLETIDKLTLKNSGTPTYNNTFNGCKSLKNIVIGGQFRNSVSFAQSTLLTHDSLMSIINALMTTSTTYTLTLGIENLAKLTDAEKAVATQKGWTLA